MKYADKKLTNRSFFCQGYRTFVLGENNIVESSDVNTSLPRIATGSMVCKK